MHFPTLCTDADRPKFECEHCKRGFARADVLAKHVGRAHSNKDDDTEATPTRGRSEEEPAEPASKRARTESSSNTLPTTSNTASDTVQAQWVQLRDIQSNESGAPHAQSTTSTSNNQRNNPTNGFGSLGTPSSNLDFTNTTYNTDGLFSLNALASAASGPSGPSNGTSNGVQNSSNTLQGYDLTDISGPGLDENISPAGTNDSNFEHTFAWLFGNTSSDNTSYTAPVDNFSSILFAQPPADPMSTFPNSAFANQASTSAAHPSSVFNPQPPHQQPQQMPVASTSALKSSYEPMLNGHESTVVYPIDNRSSVSFVNGNTLDEPKPLIDSSRRIEMLNILNNSADREAFDKCFTCKKLNSMVELYFIGFDPFYPVLHRPTMPYRQSSPFLLLAVVFLGTAWAQDKDAFNLASRLHRHVRQSIFTVSCSCTCSLRLFKLTFVDMSIDTRR